METVAMAESKLEIDGGKEENTSFSTEMFTSKRNIIDLTDVKDSELSVTSPNKSSQRKRSLEAHNQSEKVIPQKKKIKTPHVIIWICHYGHDNQHHNWSSENPKIYGVYNSYAEAKAMKERIMENYEEGGYSDIDISGTWDGEIDLIIRPVVEYEFEDEEEEDED